MGGGGCCYEPKCSPVKLSFQASSNGITWLEFVNKNCYNVQVKTYVASHSVLVCDASDVLIEVFIHSMQVFFLDL